MKVSTAYKAFSSHVCTAHSLWTPPHIPRMMFVVYNVSSGDMMKPRHESSSTFGHRRRLWPLRNPIAGAVAPRPHVRNVLSAAPWARGPAWARTQLQYIVRHTVGASEASQAFTQVSSSSSYRDAPCNWSREAHPAKIPFISSHKLTPAWQRKGQDVYTFYCPSQSSFSHLRNVLPELGRPRIHVMWLCIKN